MQGRRGVSVTGADFGSPILTAADLLQRIEMVIVATALSMPDVAWLLLATGVLPRFVDQDLRLLGTIAACRGSAVAQVASLDHEKREALWKALKEVSDGGGGAVAAGEHLRKVIHKHEEMTRRDAGSVVALVHP